MQPAALSWPRWALPACLLVQHQMDSWSSQEPSLLSPSPRPDWLQSQGHTWKGSTVLPFLLPHTRPRFPPCSCQTLNTPGSYTAVLQPPLEVVFSRTIN